MLNWTNGLVKLLKEQTAIEHSFIDEFLINFQIGNELQYHIIDSKAATYLGIKRKTLRKRLKNEYGNGEQYIENVDYIKIKDTTGSNKKYYMIN